MELISTDLSPDLSNDLQKIRSKAPVVFNITNLVAMDFTANALLALGASPVMAHAEEEIDEMVGISSALVLNIGTLDKNQIERMVQALSVAKQKQVPTVLDPVGAGATRFRTLSSKKLYDLGVTAVRGNASEMKALLGSSSTTKGVDSSLASEDVAGLAKEESQRSPSALVVSGATDYVFHRGQHERISHGDPTMTKVTAMGCVASSLLGAFLAVNPSSFRAAVHTMTVMGLCGERARNQAKGPGSFRVAFLDALSRIGTSGT